MTICCCEFTSVLYSIVIFSATDWFIENNLEHIQYFFNSALACVPSQVHYIHNNQMPFSLAVKGSHLSSEDSLPGIILLYPSLDRSIHMLVSCNRICQNSGHISLGILQRYLRTFISYVDSLLLIQRSSVRIHSPSSIIDSLESLSKLRAHIHIALRL